MERWPRRSHPARRERNGPAPPGLPPAATRAAPGSARSRPAPVSCAAARSSRCKVQAVAPAHRQVAGDGTSTSRPRRFRISPSTTRSWSAPSSDEFRAHPLEIEAERVHRQLDRGIEPGGRRRCRDDPLAAEDRSADEPDEDESEHRRLRHPGKPRQGRERDRRQPQPPPRRGGPGPGLGSRALGLDRERLVGRRPGVRLLLQEGVELLGLGELFLGLLRLAGDEEGVATGGAAHHATIRPDLRRLDRIFACAGRADDQHGESNRRLAFHEPRVMLFLGPAWLTAGEGGRARVLLPRGRWFSSRMSASVTGMGPEVLRDLTFAIEPRLVPVPDRPVRRRQDDAAAPDPPGRAPDPRADLALRPGRRRHRRRHAHRGCAAAWAWSSRISASSTI